MSVQVSLELISGAERSLQKCIIPLHLFGKTNLKPEDEFVVVKSSDFSFICRVNVTLEPLSCVFLNDYVFRADDPTKHPNSGHLGLIPYSECVTSIEASSLSLVKCRIVLAKDSVLGLPKKSCEGLVRELVSFAIVGRGCRIDCRGKKLAALLKVEAIFVCDIAPSSVEFGRISKKTVVELVDVTTQESMQLSNSFNQLLSGGLAEYKSLLKCHLMLQSTAVVVTGPSGCGKTLLVKQCCSELRCCVIMVDKLQSSVLNLEKCKQLCSQFSSYLKLFPDRTCVLVLDQLDDIAPLSLGKNLVVISTLLNLLTDVKELGVNVIATALFKRNIHPAVSRLFAKDIHIGMPNLQQRREVLQVLTQSFSKNIECDKIARMTPAFVGHDLSLLVKEAVNLSRNQCSESETDSKNLSTADIEKALEKISPSMLKTSVWSIKVKPVYWEDIGGLFQVKKRLQKCVEWPLRYPEVFKKVDLPCPHGVLLFGPPGCCKTTLARGLATECNANFFAANPSQIYSPYVGESEKNLVELFYQARLCSPSIIFLDELDSLVSQRKLEKKSHGVGEKVLSTLLTEIDGFGTKMLLHSSNGMKKLLNDYEDAEYSTDFEKVDSACDVIVVAATNRPDLIDDALLRPGRFDVILYVPPPNLEERVSILETLTEGMPIQGVDLNDIAKRTDLFSGADLKNLCNKAAIYALRQNLSASFITKEHFEHVLKTMTPSITRAQLEMYENLSSKYGTFLKKI